MSDDLLKILRADDEDWRTNQTADRIEELETKLDQAQWLLTDASVQLREGKIKTRRNRADLIDTFLAELTGNKND